MSTRKFTVAILAAVSLIALPALADSGPDAAAIYKSKCVACHGADGSGQTPTGKAMKARDLRSPEVQKLTDKEIAAVIANGAGKGKAKMPAYKEKLKPEEIQALVAFVRQLKKK